MEGCSDYTQDWFIFFYKSCGCFYWINSLLLHCIFLAKPHTLLVSLFFCMFFSFKGQILEGKIGLLFWYTMTELNQSLLEQLQRTRGIRKPLHCTNSIYDIACCSKGVSILYILHCKYSSNTKEQDRIKDSYILIQ